LSTVRKNGTRLDVSVTISPIKDFQDWTIAYSAIIRDISERKRMEQALRLLNSKIYAKWKETLKSLEKTA